MLNGSYTMVLARLMLLLPLAVAVNPTLFYIP